MATMRASGPGGQNVNKGTIIRSNTTSLTTFTVASRVEMRFTVDEATWLPAFVRSELKRSGQITKSGEIIVSAQNHRTQTENYKECVDRIYNQITEIIERIPGETDVSKSKKVQQMYEYSMFVS